MMSLFSFAFTIYFFGHDRLIELAVRLDFGYVSGSIWPVNTGFKIT